MQTNHHSRSSDWPQDEAFRIPSDHEVAVLTPPLESSRSPDWRWLLALDVVQGNAPAECPDEWVEKLVRVAFRMYRIPAPRRVRRIRGPEPALVQAWRWYHFCESSPRWLTEAYSCARMAPEEIASAVREPVTVVEAFLKGFFDLGELIDQPAALVAKVLGLVPGAGGDARDWLWKQGALLGGRPLVDAFVYGFDPQLQPEVLAKTLQIFRGVMSVRATQAALGSVHRDGAVRDLLRAYCQHLRPTKCQEEPSTNPYLSPEFIRQMGEVYEASRQPRLPLEKARTLPTPPDHPFARYSNPEFSSEIETGG